MKRVLFLTTNGTLMDGINRHILTVVPELNAMEGTEVAVCIVHPKGELHEALEIAGVKVWSLGYANGHKPGIYFSFRRVLNSFKPDIVHVHVVALMERILLIRKFSHLKFVVTIHGLGDAMLDKSSHTSSTVLPRKQKKPLKHRVEDWLNRRYVLRYDAACYISHGVRERILPNKAITPLTPVCYNPMKFVEPDGKKFKLHDLIGVSHDIPIIGTACRISKQKNPEAFTEIISTVLSRNLSAHAVVMGTGDVDILEKCLAIVNRFGIKDRFHFIGYRKDAPELVRDLTCFVMTSNWEGLPTSVLESFAAKVPVAMFRGEGGLRDIEMLNDNQSPIVAIAEKNDINGLATEICNLIDNPSKAISQAENAFEIGKKNFDVKAVAAQLDEVYDNLMLHD